MIMKKEFDWEKFKTEDIAVLCKTKEEAKIFCSMIDWNDDDICWNFYKEETCYAYQYYYCFGNLYDFIDNGYTIIEFSDYFHIDKPIPHYGEININGDCFLVKEREECSNPEWMYLCDLFGLDYDKTERIVIDGVVKYFGLRKGE